MKKIFFLFAAAIMAGSMMAQTAVQNYTVTLSDGETWGIPATNPYEADEAAIAKSYADQVASSALFRAMGGEEILPSNTLEYSFKDLMESLKAGAFYRDWEIWNIVRGKLLQNKRFREFIADRICALLKDMCQLYPASTKKTILNLLDEAISVTDQMEKHTYELADGDELQKDGKIITGRTREELNLIYSWEGLFARRIVIDNISLSEIRGYLQAARKAVADEDVSRKPEYVACYTLNNDLKVILATDRVFCRFRNGKQADEVLSITYLRDATGEYYKIIGQTWEQGVYGMWWSQTISILYDSDGNKIYENIVTEQ